MTASNPAGPSPAQSAREKTVLYVDDQRINLMLMRALFSHRPTWRLNTVTDASAACIVARAEPHDLLLLDLRLPDCHGAELLRRLRRLPAMSRVPAVAVTAEDSSPSAANGFCETWPKPLDLRWVLSRLDHLLSDAPAKAVAFPGVGTAASGVSARMAGSPWPQAGA